MKPGDPMEQVRQLLPIRDLPEGQRNELHVVRRARGRPRVIRPALEPDSYFEKLLELRAQVTASDPLVRATGPDTSRNVLDESLLQLAVECAAIKFDRLQLEKRGADASQLCSRIVSGLATVASLIVERQRCQPDEFDPRSGKMRKVVATFIDHFREAAEETLGPDAEGFIKNFEARIAGWEDRV